MRMITRERERRGWSRAELARRRIDLCRRGTEAGHPGSELDDPPWLRPKHGDHDRGEVYLGRVTSDSKERVCVLIDRQPRWFPRSEIADLVSGTTSQMPSYQGVLRDEEIRHVVAFLETLRAMR